MPESATVVRQRHLLRAYDRNLLADFDAIVERALAAADASRDPRPFLEDAIRLAKDLSWCGGEDHQHKPFVPAYLQRFLELAIRAVHEPRCQLLAAQAKRYVAACVCELSKRGLSNSGRPVW